MRGLDGDRNPYSTSMISVAFKGKSRVQHQMTGGRMDGEFHALALQTAAGLIGPPWQR